MYGVISMGERITKHVPGNDSRKIHDPNNFPKRRYFAMQYDTL